MDFVDVEDVLKTMLSAACTHGHPVELNACNFGTHGRLALSAQPPFAVSYLQVHSSVTTA